MKYEKASALIIVQNANLVLQIKNILEELRLNVDYSYNGKEGLSKALRNKYQLLIVSVTLPDMCGLDIVREIRHINHKPIIVIGLIDSDERSEIKAYNLKANIFHNRPLNYAILEAQIKSLIDPNKKGNIVKTLDILLDTDRRRVFVEDNEIALTKAEIDLIIMLINSNGEVFTREQIISNIMNCEKDRTRFSVDTLVSRLRKKLGKDTKESLIRTVNGTGYSINPVYHRHINREFS